MYYHERLFVVGSTQCWEVHVLYTVEPTVGYRYLWQSKKKKSSLFLTEVTPSIYNYKIPPFYFLQYLLLSPISAVNVGTPCTSAHKYALSLHHCMGCKANCLINCKIGLEYHFTLQCSTFVTCLTLDSKKFLFLDRLTFSSHCILQQNPIHCRRPIH